MEAFWTGGDVALVLASGLWRDSPGAVAICHALFPARPPSMHVYVYCAEPALAMGDSWASGSGPMRMVACEQSWCARAARNECFTATRAPLALPNPAYLAWYPQLVLYLPQASTESVRSHRLYLSWGCESTSSETVAALLPRLRASTYSEPRVAYPPARVHSR